MTNLDAKCKYAYDLLSARTQRGEQSAGSCSVLARQCGAIYQPPPVLSGHVFTASAKCLL